MKKVKRLAGEDRIVLDVTDVILRDTLKHSCARNHNGATAAAALRTVHRGAGCSRLELVTAELSVPVSAGCSELPSTSKLSTSAAVCGGRVAALVTRAIGLPAASS